MFFNKKLKETKTLGDSAGCEHCRTLKVLLGKGCKRNRPKLKALPMV